MNKENFESAFQRIKEAKKILLVTHDRPDGDALSSSCALIDILKGLNKPFIAYCLDEPPPQFSFLPHIEEITANREGFDFAGFDLIIALDCANANRTNIQKELLSRQPNQFTIEFDHHPKVDDYSDLELRYPWASSTAEVIYYFIKSNKIKFSKNLANCVLTGILTDTGNFLYPSTSEKAVKIASEMLIYGARFPKIMESTWRNKSLPAMKIWGKALNNLKVNRKYNIAYSVLTMEDMAESGATDEELEGIAGFLSNLEEVNALLLLREEKEGRIKGNLRTAKPDIDISYLANFLGGGGHPKAAGFSANDCKLEKTDSGWRLI